MLNFHFAICYSFRVYTQLFYQDISGATYHFSFARYKYSLVFGNLYYPGKQFIRFLFILCDSFRFSSAY